MSFCDEAHPRKNSKRRDNRLRNEMLKAIENGDSETIDIIYGLAFASIATFNNHYSHGRDYTKQNSSQLLVETVRRNPHLTLGKTATELLSLKNVGPEMALAILQSVTKLSYEWKDVDIDRQERYAKKTGKVLGEESPAFGIDSYLYLNDRDLYRNLQQYFIPSSLAYLIGVETEEFLSNIKYKPFWEIAAPLVPAINSPYHSVYRPRLIA